MKKSFTLIEVVISLSLIGMIVFVMLNLMITTGKIEKKFDKVKIELFKQNEIQARLANIFQQLIFFQNKPGIYTSQESNKIACCFFFDNGIDLDPNFSGLVFGKLYQDNTTLILELNPINNDSIVKNKKRKIILSTTVSNISFNFFAKQKDAFRWTKTWDIKNSKMPIMIKMNLNKTDFVFFVPNHNTLITYKQTAS